MIGSALSPLPFRFRLPPLVCRRPEVEQLVSGCMVPGTLAGAITNIAIVKEEVGALPRAQIRHQAV